MSTTDQIGSNLRVVVVDDEPVIRQFLQVALEGWGFETELFGNLEDGQERCERGGFDLLLADKNLPDGSGLQLCKTALADSGSGCKAILMSGYANLASAVEAIRHGVTDYFVKPLDLDDLHARLARVVHLQRLERGNRQLIVELEAKNASLEAMAVRDPLTGLYNHAFLQDAVGAEFARSARHDRVFSLALLDTDRFRAVNDQFGHAAGDKVLSRIAEIISGHRRLSDTPTHVAGQQLVARFGGDVFGLLMPETPAAGAATYLERLRATLRETALAEALELDGLPTQTMSAGFVSFPADGQDRESLISAAQCALAAAKNAGGDIIVRYSTELRDAGARGAAQHARAAHALGRSLSERSFRFVYQPIVDCGSGSIFAYEALCRPTDEGFASITELLETTVRLGRLRDLGRILRVLSIEPLEELPDGLLLFVNLHPQDLSDPHLLEPSGQLKALAKRIVFEITESEAIGDYSLARDQIAQLRRHGFRVAIDDLGAGYSSLTCLSRLEPDFVKLDMGLVRDIEHSSRAARLIRHLIDFCSGEGMPVIAEGIETAQELQVVRDRGVDLVQGYYFARPQEPFCGLNPTEVTPRAAASR